MEKSSELLKECAEKIKVSSAEIVVHGTREKPYYEIKYHDLSDGQIHIGYSSYNLDFVFDWLEECFEIVNQAADTIEQSSEGCGGWIPCSEPPKHTNEVLIFNGKSYSVGYYDGKTWVNAIHPVEWQEIRHEP